MIRSVLFVSNGNGESAIAERIARELGTLSNEPLVLEHLPLVGAPPSGKLAAVGPRRVLPSGGLVAMGNVRAFARDVRGGFIGLFARQTAFLRRRGPGYDAIVAVGDAYALALALLGRRPVVFVGTAKSVYVAPYGRGERILLRRARRVFVRDGATAAHLRERNVAAQAPGNAIADMVERAESAPLALGRAANVLLLPGSRASAYDDAVRLARVVRALGTERAGFGAVLSIAPALQASGFVRALAADGWHFAPQGAAPGVAFRASSDGCEILGTDAPLERLLPGTRVVLGQAGTGNEQAAAAGVPVVALDGSRGKEDWYRMRQRRLLGDALLLVDARPERAALALSALLDDPLRLAAMRSAGRERMGPPGGARAIAAAILAL